MDFAKYILIIDRNSNMWWKPSNPYTGIGRLYQDWEQFEEFAEDNTIPAVGADHLPDGTEVDREEVKEGWQISFTRMEEA